MKDGEEGDSAREELVSEGKPAAARAQNLANFRSTLRYLSNEGKCRKVWKYTYLSDLATTESRTPLAERLAMGKMLKE